MIWANEMRGTPWVTSATLSGVNRTIRSQYAQVPLAQSHIPRILHAKVHDDHGYAPDFTIIAPRSIST